LAGIVGDPLASESDTVTTPADCASAVTVSGGAGNAEIARAREIAQACGLPYLPRAEARAPRLLTVERFGVRLSLGGTSLSSHPGMGLVRVRRLVKGAEHDPLLDLAELPLGGSVLDATFGFGQDALVFAHAVGEHGRVVGLEASPLLAGLAMGGLRFWPEPAASIVNRIEVRFMNFRAFLAQAPAKSFDVVYFDPMFRKARPAAPDFAALRILAERAPIEPVDIEAAVRVARRAVIVKDAWPGPEITRLGFSPRISRRSAEIVYGCLRLMP
jgi:16S rRNA (guanine1516-N2)-methyltransferase